MGRAAAESCSGGYTAEHPLIQISAGAKGSIRPFAPALLLGPLCSRPFRVLFAHSDPAASPAVIAAKKQRCHRLTRADTVLTGRNAPILRQTPWQYGKYYLRAFSCLDTFLLRQNCCAPASDVFSSDFWLLRCRRAESAYSRRCCRATFLWSEADARQDEKDKKRRKDTLSGVFALVNRW